MVARRLAFDDAGSGRKAHWQWLADDLVACDKALVDDVCAKRAVAEVTRD